jgi:NADH-quinone oxidoreductase subunit M
MRPFLESIGYAHWILSVLLLLPMAGVVLVMLAPERWARWLTLIVAIAEFVLALGLWWAFDPDNGGMQFAVTMTWLPELGISYRIGLDGLSLFMVLLATAMMPCWCGAAGSRSTRRCGDTTRCCWRSRPA